MSEKNESFGLRVLQLIAAVALVAFAVYGWKVLENNGFLMFLCGAAGITVGAHALGFKDIVDRFNPF